MKRYWQFAVAGFLAALIPLQASAQLGLGSGGGGRGGGGINVGGGNIGGGRGGANVGGGGVRIGGGGNAGVRVGGNNPGVRVGGNAGAQVQTPNVRVGGKASAAPRVETPRVDVPRVQANINPGVKANANVNPGAKVNAGIRSNAVEGAVRGNVKAGARTTLKPELPNAGVDTNVKGSVKGNANVGPQAGGDIRANVNSALDGRVRAGANVGAGVGAKAGIRDNIRSDVDARVGGRDGIRGNVDAGVGKGGNIRADVDARVGDRDGIRADVDGRVRGDVNARTNLRPSWLNTQVGVNGRGNVNLNRTLATTLGAANWSDYLNRNRDRYDHWHRYGNNVNGYWRNNYSPYFGINFWSGRNIWRPYAYFNYWGNRPANYWWGNPGWVGVNRWYGGWSNWNSPYYYDYGSNVVYRDNYVYFGDQRVATAEEYAQSAAALAAIDADDVPSTKAEDWLGLGTFAVVDVEDGQKDTTEPTRFVQLAVDKKGFVAGTFYNRKTDEVFSMSGRVDKETQRMAFAIDDNKDIVFETGLFNLTQEETPVLVHFGPQETETFVFVRLEEPKTEEGAKPAGTEKLP